VIAVDPEEEAVMVLTLEDSGVSPLEAADRFAEDEAFRTGRSRTDRINGLRTERMDFSVTDESGKFSGHVAFVELAGQTYRILGLGTDKGWSEWRRVVTAGISSFAEETDPQVLSVEPWRIEMVTLSRTVTGQEFVKRWPSVAPSADIFRINRINRMSSEDVLPEGRALKRVVGSRLPR